MQEFEGHKMLKFKKGEVVMVHLVGMKLKVGIITKCFPICGIPYDYEVRWSSPCEGGVVHESCIIYEKELRKIK